MSSPTSSSQRYKRRELNLPGLVIASILLFLASGHPVPAEIEVLNSLELEKSVDWYFETDIGMLHVYAAGQLHTFDLLEQGRTLHEAIALPGAEAPGSVVPLPGMPYLLVRSADSGLIAAELESGPSSSYLLDAFTGALLWEERPRPDVSDVIVFPFDDRLVIRTGKRGETLIGLALSSGEEEWTLGFPVKTAWSVDSVLEVRGEESASIDAVSGRVLRRIAMPIPEKANVTRIPSESAVVVWRGDDFSAYSTPDLGPGEPAAGGEPPTVVADLLWEFKSKKETPTKMCREANVPCGPQLVPDDRLLLNGLTRIDLLDFRTGEMVWSRKEKRMLRATAVSPSGEHGAIPGKKTLTVINMKTGDDITEIRYPKGAKPKFTTHQPGAFKAYYLLMSRVAWPTEDEVMVILQNKKGQPRGLMRFNAKEEKLLWGLDLPEPADYPLTSAERGKLVGRVFASLALTFVSAANPFTIGGTSYYFVFTPNWRVGGSPDLDFDPYFREGLEGPTPEWLRESRRRYFRRNELLRRAQDRDAVFVTGKKGRYAIQSVDLKTGELKTLGTYRNDPIHSLEPDNAYRIAVSVERQRKRIRLLAFPE